MKLNERIKFEKKMILELNGSFYVHWFVEKSSYITIEAERYYKIKKGKIKRLSMKNFEIIKVDLIEQKFQFINTPYNWNIIIPKIFFNAA